MRRFRNENNMLGDALNSMAGRVKGNLGRLGLSSMALIGHLFAVQVGLADDVGSGLLERNPGSPWRSGIGDGLREGAHELDVVAGAGMGVRILETHAHDWGFGAVDFGWVFTDVVGDGHWYRGNWELIGEVFGGEQFHPEGAYFAGGGPHLRSDCATGHRWMPFLDLGAGATATDIRDGDISTPFEFNLQAGAGAHFFLRDNLALTVQARFIHFSNAGIKFPNLGVNALTGLVGVSWFF